MMSNNDLKLGDGCGGENRIIMHESIMVVRIASHNLIVIQLLITPFPITQIEPPDVSIYNHHSQKECIDTVHTTRYS